MSNWSVLRIRVGTGTEAELICSHDGQLLGSLTRLEKNPFASARAPDGTIYQLRATATLGGMGVADFLMEIWPAMLVGIAMMAVFLLVLLNRQVLAPVAELAAASRHLAAGGSPARLSGTGRADELGQLVRSFNRMAEEVLDHKAELEKRVAEATEKCRRAQEVASIAQRLAAIGRLAAGVAHEINNPLGGMVNAARRLEKVVPQGTREHEYLELLKEGLDRVGATVKQMTMFRPVEQDLGPVDLCETARSALRFAEPRLKDIEVECVAPEGLPVVFGDRRGLEQVLLNLIINAADAMRRSEVRRLTVKVAAAPDRAAVAVEVSDTGCGMTDAERVAAFDLFHTTKAPGEGTGLGLPIAHSIVQGHGGTLTLESRKGEGTTAMVNLPTHRKEAQS